MSRILHLTRDYPPRHCGGISTAVGGLVPALREAGHSCAVVSFDGFRPGRAVRDLVEVTAPDRIDEPLLRVRDDRDLAQVEAFARAFAPEIVQLHVDLLWTVAAKLRDRLGAPILATLHVCHRRMLRLLQADRESASLAAQEQALVRADLLVAPTRAAARWIEQDYPQTAGRIRIAGFTVAQQPPSELEADRLVSIGRFGAVKGTDRLIALLPHLLANSACRIDIVGGLPRNPRRDRRWRERILEAAGEASERVCLHGWCEPDRRDALLGRARLFLSVSRMETFGLAALEALAHGVPVCGYTDPALVETAPQQTWLDDDDPQRIAEAVTQLRADQQRCRALGRAGRDTVRPWSAIVPAWTAAYAACVDRATNC